MRVVSLWQPWATAWVLGIKRIETRHWSTDYRGPLAVHAAKRWSRDEAEWWERLHERDMRWPARPPLGAIVGVVQLTDVLPTDALRATISDLESEWGNYAPKRFGWIAVNHRMLPEPIPFPGRQSFFSVPSELLPRDFREGLPL